MKCDNCGKHEANCHYTMNVNGSVTERHLCSKCAGKMGIEPDVFGDFRNLFDDMFTGFFGTGRRALGGWSDFGFPTMTMPRIEILLDGCGQAQETDGNRETQEQKAPEQDVRGSDPEMSRKRELNVLRRQMKRAAADEDFEQAAKLRDQIHALESGK